MDYVRRNPATDQLEQKHSWVIKRDGLIFGSGWYEDEAPAPPTKADPPAYTQYFVQQAINRYNQDGRQATIDHYNSTDSIDGPWYIFIIEDEHHRPSPQPRTSRNQNNHPHRRQRQKTTAKNYPTPPSQADGWTTSDATQPPTN